MKAVEWYRRGCELGSAECMSNYALCFEGKYVFLPLRYYQFCILLCTNTYMLLLWVGVVTDGFGGLKYDLVRSFYWHCQGAC
jgi:hypothetical protein